MIQCVRDGKNTLSFTRGEKELNAVTIFVHIIRDFFQKLELNIAGKKLKHDQLV